MRRPTANRGKEFIKSTLRWRTPWNRTTTSRNCTTTRTHKGEKLLLDTIRTGVTLKLVFRFCKTIGKGATQR